MVGRRRPSMSSSAQRCRMRPLAKCTVESATAPSLPSACGSGPDGNPPTEGVSRPEESGGRRVRALARVCRPRARGSTRIGYPYPTGSLLEPTTHRSSAPRAPADRIGDQCQGARGWCRRLAVHPSVPRHTDGADHQDQPRADADSQIGNVIDERTRCSSSPETLNSHSTVPRPIRRFRTCR